VPAVPAPAALPEPDYRFTLANERTFLAWLRTSLALLAAGIAVQQLPEPLRPPWARSALSLLCVAMSTASSVGGVLRWRSVDRAVRRGERLPPLRLPWLLTAAFVVLAAVAAVLLLAGDA
jgi:putative membrane protein